MATYQKQHGGRNIIIDEPAAVTAYAFENVGCIILDGKARPILSAPQGRTYTVFFDNDPDQTPVSAPDEVIMELFRRKDVHVSFAGYWYDNKLISRYEEDGSDRRQWINFDKAIARTERELEKVINKAAEVVAAAEPITIEVPVPMVDWKDRFRTFILGGGLAYALFTISMLVVIPR